MKATVIAAPLLALMFTACADRRGASYDTPSYSPAETGQTATPSNPIYDTPPAYEESGSAATASTANSQVGPIDPAVVTPPRPPSNNANGAAIIHTVVAGDTLSGISAKYKVPVAAIRQANNMTKDTVVLGRKMVIPPVR